MFTSAKIADLQAKVSTLETQLTASNEELTSLRASFEEKATALAEAECSATASAARIAELEASEATFNDRVSAEVTVQLAALGTEPVKRDPDAKEGDSKELSRAEFKKLKPNARAVFCANGGKITD